MATRLVLGIPSYKSFSGPISNDEDRLHLTNIDFSSDGNVLAYIWKDAEYMYPPDIAARPRTLTDSKELRIRRLDREAPELKIPLDSIDLRPDGVVYYDLEAVLQVSPDSQRVAALCSRRLVLVDVSSGSQRIIEYDGEFFATFAWLSAREIAFSTYDSKVRTFWRYNIDSPPAGRTMVYSHPDRMVELVKRDNVPPGLAGIQWSPRGRFVSFTSSAETHEGSYVLLDLRTGSIQTLPFEPCYQCWKQDESAVLITGWISDKTPVALMNPTTGETEDLTDDFKKAFGDKPDITMVSPLWLPGDQFITFYQNFEYPPKTDNDVWKHELKGHVVQVHPFRVVLTRDNILQWSPIPGWVLMQGDGTFDWLALTGDKTAPISGWSNRWTWAANGKLAAKIDGGQLVVFSPELPPKGK